MCSRVAARCCPVSLRRRGSSSRDGRGPRVATVRRRPFRRRASCPPLRCPLLCHPVRPTHKCIRPRRCTRTRAWERGMCFSTTLGVFGTGGGGAVVTVLTNGLLADFRCVAA